MNITLRLPDDLHERVRAAAAESQPPLSINQWMMRAAIFLLRQEHSDPTERPSPSPGLDAEPPASRAESAHREHVAMRERIGADWAKIPEHDHPQLTSEPDDPPLAYPGPAKGKTRPPTPGGENILLSGKPLAKEA